jgi:predicted HicB family RNase H-like nuclease
MRALIPKEKIMKYKDYYGQIKYDDKARLFHGEVIGLKDVITFQGTNVEELEQAFHDSVDDYLKWCEELNQSPEQPFSGKFNLRISPELHAKLAVLASKEGVSLNSLIVNQLQKMTEV